MSAAGLEVTYAKSLKTKDDSNGIELFDDVHVELDGIDLWDAIQNGVITDEYKNREIVLDMDPLECIYKSCGAIMWGKWKYIRGNEDLKYKLNQNLWNRDFNTNEENDIIGCGKLKDNDINSISCKNTDVGCLFDLSLDPCEYNDVSSEFPEIVGYLKQRLMYYYRQQIGPLPYYIGLSCEYVSIEGNDQGYWAPFQTYHQARKIFEQTLYQQYKVSTLYSIIIYIIYMV